MTRTQVRAGRIAALAAAVALAVALAGRAAGGPSAEAGTEASSREVAVTENAPGGRYVVRPGDTLWEIARALVGPEGDPRPVVEDLRDANGLGTAILQPGTSLVLPPAA
ncbi:MAG: LysM peptidoglycan-binding domain-containing protein [Actinomycetota bacterium]